jgi:hypothetical protein
MHFCTLPGSAISGLVASLTKEKAKVHLDLGPLLKGMNLEDLPSSAQPKTALVDALATEYKRLRDKGYDAPFPYVDIAKWVPVVCTEGGAGTVPLPLRRGLVFQICVRLRVVR